MELRTFKILEAVIDEYIKTGEPVGSKTLAEKAEIKVSPATIRNEMAILENEGYLEHPHTSAGRVPTFKGYRLYIERFLPEAELSDEEKFVVDDIFREVEGMSDEAIIENASHALAELTKCAIVSTNQTGQFSVISKVEVIPTGKRLYVLLLITSKGDIKNRVCRLQFDLTTEQMQFFTKFVNDNLAGLNLGNISDQFIDQLTAALGSYMVSLSPLLKAVADLTAEISEEKINLEGETNLVVCEELPKNEIVRIIDGKNEFTQLLASAFTGINVMFGREQDTFVVSNSSLITSSFKKGENKAGSFGVIGPMRLDYKKVIPYIDYFTRKVTDLLSGDFEDDDFYDDDDNNDV